MKLRTVVGLGLAIVWSGCVQILDADYEYKPQCTSIAECDDQNPCTTDTCSAEQACEHTAVTDGPLAQQVAGDCRRDDCLAGEVVPTNDDADIVDDNESCTTDSCNAGNPLHTAVVEGQACTLGMSGGQCLMGVCVVECDSTKPCDDMNPCTSDTCTELTGTCAFAPLDGMPTPGFQEPVGDCKVHVCQQGVDTAMNDDADVPDDMNSCTENICTNGVGSNPGVSSGTPCVVGQPAVCDGQGQCVECNVPADCVALPPDDDCQTRTCVNNVCGQSFTAMGTPISAQSAGDCKQVVCDGKGGFIVENLDTDLPEDNNPCTKNVCIAGVPANPNEAAGFSCGAPLFCDGMGNCIGCNTPNDCINLPPDDFCKKRTCVNFMCGMSFTPAGTDLPTGQTAQDCKVVECDAMGNIVTSADVNDKPVDGNQCTQDVCSMQGVPSNPPEPVTTVCNQSGGTLCNGAGACKKANGAVCAAAVDCLSNFCVDGFCCNTACTGTCQACSVVLQGQGTNGTCGPIIANADPSNECTNGACSGASTCKLDNGVACTMAAQCLSGNCIDGVCCNSACGNGITTDCQACSTAAGAMANGTCSAVTAGKVCRAAAGTCDVTETCNGVSTVCPADAVAPNGTVCRTALPGGCDIAETCNGSSNACPADNFVPPGTVCRPAANVCDVPETCTGVSGLCPLDMFQPATTVCRPASGACDVEEACTGSSPACPADAATPAGTVCRVAISFCDVDEVCDGMILDCPADAFAATGTVCSPQSCMGSIQSNADTCDGLGLCLDGGMLSCGAYACDGPSCRVSCTTDLDCTTGFVCQGSMCK